MELQGGNDIRYEAHLRSLIRLAAGALRDVEAAWGRARAVLSQLDEALDIGGSDGATNDDDTTNQERIGGNDGSGSNEAGR